MIKIFELKNARIALGVSILLFSIGIFIENSTVASLSTLKADKSQIELNRIFEYGVEKPLPPVNEAKYLTKPLKPPKDSEQEMISNYEIEFKKYETNKENLIEQYNKKLEKYKKGMQEYKSELASMKKNKYIAYNDYKRSLDNVKRKIKQRKIDINKIYAPLLIRFLGSILFLIGFVGVLFHGDQYERLGILLLTGFALKTIIGL